MSFTDIMADNIGREVEVYFVNDFVQGELLSVGNRTFRVKVLNPSYTDPFRIMHVNIANVEYVRVN